MYQTLISYIWEKRRENIDIIGKYTISNILNRTHVNNIYKCL